MVMGQATSNTEVLVIGAGPGGYVSAIRAAQLGYDVTLVDKAGELGGMCLHHGCIPSKALIHAVNLYYQVRHADKIGITANATLDFAKTHEWKQSVISQLYTGIKALCDKHSIRVIKATARFQTPTRAILEGEDLEFNAIEFRHCIIATGSAPRSIPGIEFGGRILSSKELLELNRVPQSLCVIGGGYIGVELGTMLSKAGSKVTIVEAGDSILGVIDKEFSTVAQQRLSTQGITVLLGTAVEAVTQEEGSVIVKTSGTEKRYDYCLIAIGHKPITQGLQLDLAGVKTDDKGFIIVNEQCKTSAQHIYAVGDVTGGVMLAHKASAQGKVAAENIAGQPSAFDPQGIPAVIFTDPEIASVGLRETEARERYGDAIKIGKFPFAALGKALAITEPEGFIKIITDANDVIIGVHGVGPGVTDYISEAALAMEMGATAQDLALTIHPHPTLSESLSEASEALLGHAIHIYQPKK